MLSAEDCINVEIENFLSLCRYATVHCGIRTSMNEPHVQNQSKSHPFQNSKCAIIIIFMFPSTADQIKNQSRVLDEASGDRETGCSCLRHQVPEHVGAVLQPPQNLPEKSSRRRVLDFPQRVRSLRRERHLARDQEPQKRLENFLISSLFERNVPASVWFTFVHPKQH